MTYNEVSLMRALDPSMSLTTVGFFLVVAKAHPEGISCADISCALFNDDSTQLSSRRYLDLLGERGRGRKKGLALIGEHPHPTDLRMKLITLTARGCELADRLGVE